MIAEVWDCDGLNQEWEEVRWGGRATPPSQLPSWSLLQVSAFPHFPRAHSHPPDPCFRLARSHILAAAGLSGMDAFETLSATSSRCGGRERGFEVCGGGGAEEVWGGRGGCLQRLGRGWMPADPYP